MLSEANDWLNEQLKQHISRQVVYRRADQSVTVTATIGSTLLKLGDDFGGVRIERTDRDYLIAAADLVLDGQPVAPQPGDTIEDGNDPGGQTLVYEVRAPEGEPPWRWSDHYRNLLRIHAKWIGEA